ncbi:uncharacterized protein [Anabrus simplex]|uniref:uncharacterized protein n=1 Tax=Anabrus simplex TaxID=316456 RepID=UPI0035A319B5
MVINILQGLWTYSTSQNSLNLHTLFKMDLEVKIKEEPACFEETSNTSCDNYKIISGEMHLKEEPRSELAVPRETQPSSNVKNEITVDEHPVGQLVACVKEEDK